MNPLERLESQKCRDAILDYQNTGDYEFLDDVFSILQDLAVHIVNKKHWYRYEQDMVQEVMFHVVDKDIFNKCDVDKPKTIARFLYRVCYNKMVSYLRRQRHYQHLSLEDAAERYMSDAQLVNLYSSNVCYNLLTTLERDIFDFCVNWFQLHNSVRGMVSAVVGSFNIQKSVANVAVRRIIGNAFNETFNESQFNSGNLRLGRRESLSLKLVKEKILMPRKTLADLQRERRKSVEAKTSGETPVVEEEAKVEEDDAGEDKPTVAPTRKEPVVVDVRSFSRKLPGLSDEQKKLIRGKKAKAVEQAEKKAKPMKDDLSRYLQVMDEEQLVQFAEKCGVEKARLERYVALFKKSNALARMNLYAAVRQAIIS